MKKITIILLLIILLNNSCSKKEKNQQVSISHDMIELYTIQSSDIDKTITYTGYVNFESVIKLSTLYTGKINKVFVNEGDNIIKGQVLAELDDYSLFPFLANFNIAQGSYRSSLADYIAGSLPEAAFKEIESVYLREKSMLKFAEDNLEIKSPIDGMILKNYYEENFTYNPEITLFDIVSDYGIHTETFIKPIDAEFLSINHPVKLSTGVDNNQFLGIVSYISSEIDVENRLIMVKVALKNEANLSNLRNNQFIILDFVIDTIKDAIIIPKQALINDNKVMTIANNIIHKKEVTTGIKNRDYIEIIHGLDIGEQIITSGFERLQDGMLISD